MTVWKVNKAIGNAKNDRPDLLEPDSLKWVRAALFLRLLERDPSGGLCVAYTCFPSRSIFSQKSEPWWIPNGEDMPE
jgi:hypothetical protein